MKFRFVQILLCVIGASFLGCAEPIEDIDRTQGNLIQKTDFDHEWHMLQTVTGVPATHWVTFVGETSVMERVRWEIHHDYIIAYRSYQRLRNAENPSGTATFDGTENPIAAYSISRHVDIKRQYNSATGEQSNVISENTSDRPWFERAPPCGLRTSSRWASRGRASYKTPRLVQTTSREFARSPQVTWTSYESHGKCANS